MIQRIQTIYLLIAEILIGTLFFVPFAKIAAKEGGIYRFDINGVIYEGVQRPETLSNSLPLIILCAVSLTIVLITIFLYKNRMLQMRLCTINIFVLLGLGSLIYYYVSESAKLLSGIYSFTIFLLFPLIAAILIYLAIRAIKKDEMLVRSIDRIR